MGSTILLATLDASSMDSLNVSRSFAVVWCQTLLGQPLLISRGVHLGPTIGILGSSAGCGPAFYSFFAKIAINKRQHF
jgi:hypothetical protein